MTKININVLKIFLFAFVFFAACVWFAHKTYAITVPEVNITGVPNIELHTDMTDDPKKTAAAIQLLFMLAIITLAPSLIMMVTCFPRILIALHFLRAAMATQQMPPNQILIALALFMSLALMGPTITSINNDALQPLTRGEITQQEAFVKGMAPLREFMFRQVTDKDLALFWELSGEEEFNTYDDIPNQVLIPAFLLGEIVVGFKIGVFIYIPFIVIDMVVASILMAMGMMMLPPAMISLPFKILLFVSVDGWNLFIRSIIAGFH
ncbi:hypothetical protein AGMMS49975_22310 [Clostridia bacterium]|nr:hypothetical protein AGMMS49975_22310 [Clostridia bacterium]